MSVNLEISFELHGIRAIHDAEDEKTRSALIAGAEAFLEAEGLSADCNVDFLGREGNLAAYTTHPVIISRSHVWVPEVTERWRALCQQLLPDMGETHVNVEYPDEV